MLKPSLFSDDKTEFASCIRVPVDGGSISWKQRQDKMQVLAKESSQERGSINLSQRRLAMLGVPEARLLLL